jgi:hypothetical protein
MFGPSSSREMAIGRARAGGAALLLAAARVRGQVRRDAGYLVAMAFVLALLPASAYAGRLIATGHDADLHCAEKELPSCHYLKVAVDYIRAGAPDPSKPVLVLDNNGLKLPEALDLAYGPGVMPRVVMDPSSPAFSSAPLNTGTYSAILVASDASCGGCDLNQTATATTPTPDSDAITARKSAIAAFFNAGGGILALAGANHGGANETVPSNAYYGFVPLPVGGAPVTPPFTLTAVGMSLGFVDNPESSLSDINCCATHNSFTLPPPGSALQVSETDTKGLAETLVAEGSISGGGIVKKPTKPTIPPAFGPGGVIRGLPSAHVCLSKRHFTIHIRRYPGIFYAEVIVFLNHREVAVVKGRNGQISAPIDLRGFPRGTFPVKITVITTTGSIITGTRTYHTCRRKRLRPHGRSPL